MSRPMVSPAKNSEIAWIVRTALSSRLHVVNLEDDGRTARYRASVPVSRQDSLPRPVPYRPARRPGARHPADPAMTPLYDQRGVVTGEPMPAHTAKMAAAIASSR